MTDDPRVTVQDLIGRQRDPSPEVPANQPSGSRLPDRHERLWLVLATHVQGLLKSGVVDERSAVAIAGVIERTAESNGEPSADPLRHQARAIEERVDAGLQTELVGAATLGIAMEDWSATAMRLGLRATLLDAAAVSTRMQAAMIAMADLHSVSLMQGFHSGQPVQPVTFGHLLGGAIGPVGTGLATLLAAADRVNRSPLGAGTMSGEVVGAERAETATWLGFESPLPNTFDAVSNVEDAVAALDGIAAIAAPVARMLDELATLVRTDPSSLVFAESWMREDAHLPGFSAVEGLVELAAQFRGSVADAGTLATRLRGLPYGPLGANADWIDREVSGALQTASDRFAAVERLFRAELTVNRAYLANRAGRDYTTSNDLAAFLMTEEQLPPSISRNIASLTMRRMREERIEMSAVTPEMLDTAAMMVIGRELKVEMETLGRWFAPRRFLERRLVEGAPAPSKTREWLDRESADQRRYAEAVSERQRRIREAEEGVRRWVAEMAGERDD